MAATSLDVGFLSVAVISILLLMVKSFLALSISSLVLCSVVFQDHPVLNHSNIYGVDPSLCKILTHHPT